ncbi:nucleotidyltransferase [Rhodopseudomonas sp. HC1]|uniref:SMODS domain-containing nucleotidyltransferase n=1 Tax=Rhodopseudomonas infernalis TaxID=2897386 RepID=UPI001EE896A4|nr:nucleotidyltransferase [Rhodopseudomonas infernalis]MCG6205837.1 nucleotidyltransferase [Rhodopseudomonas infernalis]
MKLVSLFDDFLKDTVNLNKTRIDLLDASIPALKSFVRESDWKPKVRTFVEQGSWAHQTIIRPVDGGEFDADLLVMVDKVDGWTAAEYVNSLGRVFSGSKAYGDKTKTWDYCVTITYAGDRRVDLAPCVVGRLYEGSLEVCNRRGTFELTSPIEYTEWMKERNAYSGNNSFRKVTRLVKYLRDIKHTFTCPSVLLTTLLGNEIQWFEKGSEEFADVPTTLRTLMGRLDNRLRIHPTRPAVTNPKLPSEDFSSLFGTDDQYSNFRTAIARYRKWIDEAHATEGRQESIAAWQRVFGSDFAKGEVLKTAQALTESGSRSLIEHFLDSTAAHGGGIVDLVRDLGISILPPSFARPPHIQAPPWRSVPQPADIAVTAEWRSASHVQGGRMVATGQVCRARGGLYFRASRSDGTSVPSEYDVKWRITNTGAEAMSNKAGRGGFEISNKADGRWEELVYRGIHIAEAFVVRRSDDVLVGVSRPFYVVIE